MIYQKLIKMKESYDAVAAWMIQLMRETYRVFDKTL